MTEEYSIGNSREQLRANRVLFNALFTGVGLFLIIVVVLIKTNGEFLQDDSLDKIFLIIASVIAIISLISAISGYKKRITSVINSALSLNEKLKNYRIAMIFYLALCEGAALFSTICLMLTGNYWCVIITTVMMIAMYLKRPSKQRLVADLQLDRQQQQEL